MVRKHKHRWQPSQSLLRRVGLKNRFWRGVYLRACKCGALKKVDGSVVERKPVRC